MKSLLWLDLETTGLDPESDDILQVGVARTDDAGVITESREWVVGSYVSDEELDPVVLKMHTESGLLARVRNPLAWPLQEVEVELLEFIGAEKPTLAGNNIGFDAEFLRYRMRDTYRALEYRTGDVRKLDVSMLRRAARAWGLPDYPKMKAHLALDDVKASIAEFLHWRKAFGMEKRPMPPSVPFAPVLTASCWRCGKTNCATNDERICLECFSQVAL